MTTSPKKMSVYQLTLLTAVNMTGSGIILLPTKLAQVGTISILSWLVTAVGSLCLALAFAKCGMFSRHQGMGGYAEYAFGRAGSFLANYTYAVAVLIANMAIAIACVGYAQAFLGIQLSATTAALAAIAVLWVSTCANFFGARVTGRIGSVTVWCVLGPVLLLSVVGWHWFDVDLYIQSWDPHGTPFFPAVSASISMTLWSFLGLESACVNAHAVDNPRRNVPIAVLAATIGVAILYIVSTNLIAGIIPGQELASSNAPFGLVFAKLFSPEVGRLVMGMMVISCAGSTLGWQFTIGKLFEEAARERFFPKVFVWTNRWGAPVKGMLIITTLQTVLGLMTASPALFNQFNILVNLAVVTNLVPYLLAMASVPLIMRHESVTVLDRRVTVVIASLGMLYSLFAISSVDGDAMYYGALVTFLGFCLWGYLAPRFDTKALQTQSSVAL